MRASEYVMVDSAVIDLERVVIVSLRLQARLHDHQVLKRYSVHDVE